jgi:hypothetical protein
VPLADMRTAEHVTAKIESDFAAGKNISLGIADGIYLTLLPRIARSAGIMIPTC